jgi:hypothetical protein
MVVRHAIAPKLIERRMNPDGHPDPRTRHDQAAGQEA